MRGLSALIFLIGLSWGMHACLIAIASPEDRARWAKADQEADARVAAHREQKIKDPRSQFEYQACKAVQDHVREVLVAPSTADFPRCSIEPMVSASYKGNGHYEIYSYVDSQNAFGAMLRKSYWADVDIAAVDADGNIKDWTINNFGMAK
jgi:hypothetical protein